MKKIARDWVAVSKVVVLPLLLLPLCMLLAAGLGNQLGPDPAKALVDQTGLWAMRLLLLCLAMTPLRHITRRNFWGRYRRMLGLFALLYALVHVCSYVFLLFGAHWSELLAELTKRPYVIAGSAALLLMLPLGFTSTRSWQRRLRYRWVQLHRLIYPLSLLVLLHFFWVKKLGIQSVWPYALTLFCLLGVRLWWFFRQSAGLV
ncbi:MAG: sulfoxide reductase heme-binding subunit YedZ [bacterium]|nr:sulfoxide reductase heme-binding subunit YedZ [bacterium]